MKYYGDISNDHRLLVAKLETLERWFNDTSESPPISLAKGLTCLAHDYFCMEMEEEGNRLLDIAEKKCPGYFKDPILEDCAEDMEFACLVGQLINTMGLEKMVSLGFKDE